MVQKLSALLVVAVVALGTFTAASEASQSLSWGSAKRAAKYKARKLIRGWESGTKVDFCIRWSKRDVRCGVSAWRRRWSSYLDMYVRTVDCSDTVRVWKSKSGRRY